MNVNPFSYLIEKLKGKVDKSGDTMSGMLKIDQRNGTISTEGYSYIHLGNSTPTGTDKNSTGSIRLFAGSGKYANIVAGNLTANRAIVFPDNGGTVALTSDIPTIKTVNETITANAYRWVMFPAGRIVLSATVYGTSNVVQLMLDPDTNIYRARWYINMNTTSFSAELFSANTGYSITYQYIDV